MTLPPAALLSELTTEQLQLVIRAVAENRAIVLDIPQTMSRLQHLTQLLEADT